MGDEKGNSERPIRQVPILVVQSNAHLPMVGDLTYDAHLLEEGHLPGVGERRSLDATTKAINELREKNPGLMILAAHDPGAAARLASVTSALAERKDSHAAR